MRDHYFLFCYIPFKICLDGRVDWNNLRDCIDMNLRGFERVN